MSSTVTTDGRGREALVSLLQAWGQEGVLADKAFGPDLPCREYVSRSQPIGAPTDPPGPLIPV